MWNLGGGIIPKDISYKIRKKTSIVIQNDVWLGQGVTMFGGVTVHNGAVVAGNSVVAKDVPPYAIVAGNPARIIKYRFDKNTIKKLLQIEWWYWDNEFIRKNGEWFARETKDFATHFYREAVKNDPLPNEKNPFANDLERFKILYSFFPDMDEKFGIWRRVISEFAKNFANKKDVALILCVTSHEERLQLETFLRQAHIDCSLYIVENFSELIEQQLISISDYHITSRSLRTVRRTCIADKYGVIVLAGTDEPIFV